jgi:hypothetical protein
VNEDRVFLEVYPEYEKTVLKRDAQRANVYGCRDDLQGHLSEENFSASIAKRFALRRCERLPNGRGLWLVEIAHESTMVS